MYNLLIKSPWYTGGNFMFLYWFIRRLRLRRQLFGFLSFWHDCWPWPVDYLIRFWSIFVVTLTYIFQGQIWNLLYISQKWSDCRETKSKHINWTLGLKCDHRIWPWPWPWPWIFKVKYRICYISAKNGPIATKRKHIDWILGLKCDHWVWPWPWPWPWIFKVKYGISYISAKRGLIAAKRQANIWIELQVSNVTNGFDHDHNLDLWILKSNVTLTFDHTHDLDHGFSWSNLEIAVSQLGRAHWYCTKWGGSRSFMTMTMTIWCQVQVYGSTR